MASTKITLSVLERLQITTLLPQNGGLIEMGLVKEIRDKVKFSAEEIEEYQLRDIENGSVVWNPAKAKLREYTFADSEIQVLKKGVDEADKRGAITLHNLDLAQMISKMKAKK